MVLNRRSWPVSAVVWKCCLIYEHPTYKELGKTLPKVGKKSSRPRELAACLDPRKCACTWKKAALRALLPKCSREAPQATERADARNQWSRRGRELSRHSC